jgi:hypothetical protein
VENGVGNIPINGTSHQGFTTGLPVSRQVENKHGSQKVEGLGINPH